MSLLRFILIMSACYAYFHFVFSEQSATYKDKHALCQNILDYQNSFAAKK